MNIEHKLEQLKSRYQELNSALSDPAIYSDPAKLADLSKEHSDLKILVEDYDKWQEIKETITSNEEIIIQGDDLELIEMTKEENYELKKQIERLEGEIKIRLVPKDEEDYKNAIVEIRAGTGGNEAAIFAGDLFEMYRRYADTQNWKLEIMDLQEAPKGGYKEIIFSLSGNEIFGRMKFESGVHRVQRVP
ncbi:MAG: PCRF domain-containing protein, partial [Balneolales bacterium]